MRRDDPSAKKAMWLEQASSGPVASAVAQHVAALVGDMSEALPKTGATQERTAEHSGPTESAPV